MTQVNIILDIKNCTDCPFKKSNRGQGECWEFCSHKDSPKLYKNILWGCQEQFSSIPKWCPLGLKEI